MAAHTMLPVIGVPMNASLGGMDALLAIVQMPPGVPVGSVGIGSAGARNAAWLAVRILALQDLDLRKRLQNAIEEMTEKVLADDASIQS